MKPGALLWFELRVQRASAITLAPMLWKLLGMLCVAIGIINAFIPLLPTTVFLLIGVWAYGKGDPALRESLLNHPRYGASLRRWVEYRQISRRGKLAACIGIVCSASVTAYTIGPKPMTGAILVGLLALCIYLATRQEPPQA
jgi:uncharacterized membrane protein YbaN (DUF454 family)